MFLKIKSATSKGYEGSVVKDTSGITWDDPIDNEATLEKIETTAPKEEPGVIWNAVAKSGEMVRDLFKHELKPQTVGEAYTAALNQQALGRRSEDYMRQREEDKDADVKELHLKINGVTKDLSEKVELTERRIMEKIEELKKDIADHNQKEDSELRKIWEFKWMAAGGIIAVAWLLSHVKLEALSKLF